MLEAEWNSDSRSASGVGNICDFVEALLRSLVQAKGIREEMDVLWAVEEEGAGKAARKKDLVLDALGRAGPWTRMTYSDAIRELESRRGGSEGFAFEPKWGRALQSEHERWLSESLVGGKFILLISSPSNGASSKGPVFITDYPLAIKPFYMRVNDDQQTVACFDLIVPGGMGELVGGSVREERLEVLEGRMADLLCTAGAEDTASNESERDSYGWYRDLRKYGGVPHMGFGMGFERLVGWLGGIENIRECVPFPRWAGKLLL